MRKTGQEPERYSRKCFYQEERMFFMAYDFYAPTRVLFGAGQLNHLHEQAMPGKKAKPEGTP